MNNFDRVAPAVAAVLGGFVAGYVVLESEPQDYSIAATEFSSFSVLVTPQWAGTLAAVTALLVLTMLLVRRSATLAAVAAVAAAVVIALPAVIPVATGPAVSVNGVGAGTLLAVSAYLAAGRRSAQAALAIGLLGALLLRGGIDAARPTSPRWSVSLPDPFYPSATVPVPVLLVTALAMCVVAVRGVRAVDTIAAEIVSTRTVVVGLALPIIFLGLYAALGSTTAGAVSWVVAVAIAVGAVVVASRLLPQCDGTSLLVGLAVAAASVSGLVWFVESWWLMIVVAALLMSCALVGLRWPMPRVGIPSARCSDCVGPAAQHCELRRRHQRCLRDRPSVCGWIVGGILSAGDIAGVDDWPDALPGPLHRITSAHRNRHCNGHRCDRRGCSSPAGRGLMLLLTGASTSRV